MIEDLLIRSYVFVLLEVSQDLWQALNKSKNKISGLQVKECLIDSNQTCNQGLSNTNKKASRRGGYTNQIPLTIKPYPPFKL